MGTEIFSADSDRTATRLLSLCRRAKRTIGRSRDGKRHDASPEVVIDQAGGQISHWAGNLLGHSGA